ncbi:MAG: GNAT family N-acetyltransferase [Candidatus Thermoplasmatota archaeon]|nr:GNAT family N-acetyltransferase [Candidatus Thermoplasmatota archaeon]
MEKVSNVKLDWNIILSSQKKMLKEKIKDLSVDNIYAPIIEMLNNNKIPSRVIMSNGAIGPYGYIMSPQGIDDRLICSMGFMNKDDSYKAKGSDVVEWFLSIASKTSKLLILDGIFNGEGFFDELPKFHFNKAYRVKMIGNLDLVIKKLAKESQKFIDSHHDFIELQNDEISSRDIAAEQSGSYKGTPDEFLLISKNGMNITPDVINSGYYGKILTTPSRIINNGEIIGSIQVSDGSYELLRNETPLLVDLFVAKNYQGKGYGRYLIYQASKSLRNLGYSDIQLWVNRNSNSYDFYRKMGFEEEGEDDLMYYRDFRNE